VVPLRSNQPQNHAAAMLCFFLVAGLCLLAFRVSLSQLNIPMAELSQYNAHVISTLLASRSCVAGNGERRHLGLVPCLKWTSFSGGTEMEWFYSVGWNAECSSLPGGRLVLSQVLIATIDNQKQGTRDHPSVDLEDKQVWFSTVQLQLTKKGFS
jgi:hypothetical protein